MSKITFLNLGRGCGKTIQAIKRAHETGAVIIVLNRDRLVHVMRMAESLNISIHTPITFSDYINYGRVGFSHYQRPIIKVIIEDADDIFMSLFRGVDIEMITFDIDTKRGSIL